ncbi:YmfQ family protein [Clostridium oryzae]|uniref:Phage portal protein n=1 Tax=Clostridium oryzae TaxID=1450648 RepID=A0A1V4IEM9_9CLOT|nr:YmfQ family protein [Clostridium oryzae]OPJ58431.1 hypothetical protein CLORY_35810 [Clostridium oryzae]
MLKDYVPPFLLKSKVFTTIYNAQQKELDNYNAAIDDIADQCFIDKATWGLKYWEEFLGIAVDETKPEGDRRSVIKAKLRGTGTVTVSLIKNVAESFGNGGVAVTENTAPYTFEVKFNDIRGVPTNIDDLKAAVEEIKPAHLKVIYTFTYTLWEEVKKLTWEQVKNGTWKELKTRKVI